MDKEQQVKYLANVYAVLAADGDVDRLEERVFEQISRGIQAGYFERKQALELAGSDGLPAVLDVRWSDQIRNLEDMFFAGLCDDSLESAEKKVIVAFARTIGISQKQLDQIRAESRKRYADFQSGRR